MAMHIWKEDALYEGKEIKNIQREREKLHTLSADYYIGEMAETAGVFHRRQGIRDSGRKPDHRRKMRGRA